MGLNVRRRRHNLPRKRGQLRRPAFYRCAGHRHRMVSPGNNVGRLNIVVQLDIGRGDDGLAAIVTLGRNREDGLLGELRIAVLWFWSLRAARVKRRQILRGRIVDHISRVEAADFDDARALRHQLGESPCQHQNDPVIEQRLRERDPRHAAGHENIGPERRGCRTDRERRGPAAQQDIDQIAAEAPRPRLEFHQQFRGLGGLRRRLEFHLLGDIFQP